MAKSWNYDRASDHIEKKLNDVENVTIVEYRRDMSLEGIPANKAYRVDGVHLYADILNLDDMLHVTDEEGVTCHRRTLRFLNLHQRAVHRVLSRCDARRVDFHNQRLHAVVANPYNSEDGAEAKRICRAVAIAQLIIDVLQETDDADEHIPNAKIRVGIDSGVALGVNNGRRGGREPLFLGDPANRAAKLSSGGTKSGIYLTNNARNAVGLAVVDVPSDSALTPAEIQDCQDKAALGVSKDTIVKEWREDLEKNPIGSFGFSRHTPPLRSLDITTLTPANTRRQEAVSVYADIDGFTAYVARHIEDSAEDVVRVFHVIRAELDRVLTCDFDGRRIRFIGDCLHGLLCEGTAQITDEPETVSTATLCAGALRSSFELSLDKLEEEAIDVAGLGLAIGLELGPMTVTRLGMQGDRIRCSVSRGVLTSEAEQARCTGDETAIGRIAYDAATQAVRDLFGTGRKVKGLDYNEAVEALSQKGDETARATKRAAFELAAPAIAAASDRTVRPFAENK
uniref:adenylate/guanylate cyclase domain-containing protein n=1 Tax=Altererythrobacter segetis TaxID=1104773 RepID=UPI00140966D5|nr:adenylate/guanylate cyclase domain-containing protein [Altererythrobacter segetis]